MICDQLSESAADVQEHAIQWYKAGELESLFAEGDCHGITVNGHRIGLFRVDADVYALDDLCTHGNALLSDGEMDGHGIECPLHAGLFDVRDGSVMCAPLTRATRCHKVRIQDDAVYVAVPEKTGG
ncbi:non-heme iron oxygenase ferredoxin subunit [Advenella mimigardefordensis]|uniref:non-heme iron oxygenase ferredoxin subunit n=1 Tax=Advenella mimigardefordensis TaxID=302406 RepID=UPI00046D78DF|nr:non-heme iron oxygenase ferredoxin subunit [Advenella mimigardefordensis]